MTLTEWLCVFAGGGTGAIFRAWVSRWLAQPDGFPWATLAINVLGSAFLGVLTVLCKDRPTWFLLLGTGFCGGFTTFSTFSVELVRLLESGHWLSALGYAGGSVLAGVLAAYVAIKCCSLS
ncbi:MAG: fluoride efflux transporter CrcB [Fimbriiglobus sp.]